MIIASLAHDSPATSVGFIGLGAMGKPMVINLAKKLPKGSQIHIYDIVTAVVDETAALFPDSIFKCASAKEVAEKCDVILTMLPEGAHVRSAYLDPDSGILSAFSISTAKLLIDCSTIDTSTNLYIKEQVLKKSPQSLFYDAPVSGGVIGAVDASMAFFLGCSESDPNISRLTALLSTMGGKVIPCGGPSLGLSAKLSNNYLSGAIAIACSEAMDMGMRAGVDAHVLASVFSAGTAQNTICDKFNPVPGVCPKAPASNGYKGGFRIKPAPFPGLDLPASSATVRVQAVDTTTRMVCNAAVFIQPPIAHHSTLNLNTMCFLLEHKTDLGSEYVLFDCGSRKDFWNGSPQTNKMIASNLVGMQVDHGVDEILASSGFDLENLKSIVWSHWHWDHIGDGSKFPASVDIVVGPGFTAEFAPGWPEKPDSPVLASDLRGHRIHEPEFDTSVAGFTAHDYFGDGSFYLLDVPGHALGHICGLARTTPDTFIFMGADACHFAGAFRPTPYLPLPADIPSDQLDSYYPSFCPCSVFTAHHPAARTCSVEDSDASRTNPFYKVSRVPGTVYIHGDAAQASIDKLRILDAYPGVFICLAHDAALFETLPIYNIDPDQDINDWKTAGYKENTRWAFLNELPKGDSPGRKALVQGLRREDKVIVWDEGKGFIDVQ
ncbi:Lactamase-B domain-containing protein [Fusarium sp. Ph1]|nr:Lactamase-B domain-containing protein [Fusarium sp. Ph1]